MLVHLAPGDPIMAALDRPGVTEAVRQQWRESFGLDRPLGEQYVRWLGNAVRGELGWSFSYRRPVRDVIADALPRTLLLVGLGDRRSASRSESSSPCCSPSDPAARRDRWLGRVLLLLYSVPDFWLALVALLMLRVPAAALPAERDRGSRAARLHVVLGARLLDRLQHLVLPVTTLTLLATAAIARHQRSALVEVHAERLDAHRASPRG